MPLLKAQGSDGKKLFDFELFGMRHLGTDPGQRNVRILQRNELYYIILIKYLLIIIYLYISVFINIGYIFIYNL